MTGTSLRFGLMCQGPTLQAWQAAALDDLIVAGSFQLALLIRPAPSPSVRPRGLGKVRDPELRRTLLWRLYQRLRVRWLRSGRTVDRSKAFAAVDVVTCAVERRGRHSEYFSKTDVETIRSYDLDFILRFGFGIIRGDILDAARYGVWSYHHDDERVIRGGPPCFWEVARGHMITGAILQRLTDALDAGVVLYRGQFGTHWEYGANRDQVFFGSADWPARVGRQILAGDTSIVTGVPSATAAPIRRAPGNRAMVAFLAGQIRNLGVSRLKYWFRYELWNVGVCREPIEAALARGRLNDVSWAPSLGRRRFIADPFAIRTATGVTVYVEDLDFAASGKGRIARFALAESWNGWHLEEALETREHLSYPFLFEAEGQVWCVPESYEARACRLYRVAADGTLRMEAVLLENAEFVDPTLFQHDGRWWLFCTDRAKGDGLKLYAYHARDFRGPWAPHALNPLKCDIASARPAGPPFLLDGALCRPAQDCSLGYGSAVVVHRIMELSPERFREVTVGRIRSDAQGPYPDGFHTLVVFDGWLLVDGKRRMTSPLWFRHRRRAMRLQAQRLASFRTAS
jgi:hypothetical protein